MERLDRTMKAILRAGAYELIARGDVPVGAVVSEYVAVAKALVDGREAGFPIGLLAVSGNDARGTQAPHYRTHRAEAGSDTNDDVTGQRQSVSVYPGVGPLHTIYKMT